MAYATVETDTLSRRLNKPSEQHIVQPKQSVRLPITIIIIMTTSTTLRPSSQGSRLAAVDALRGFALLAIILLYNLEHYNIFYAPMQRPEWLQWLDAKIVQIIYFIFAGKAYATFSLLFGFSFFIQLRNARRRGCDFRMRFAWRMLLLLAFAEFHSLFYNGDILTLYAVCGLILIPASSWKDRTVLLVGSFLMLQPWCWAKIIYALFNPDYIDNNSLFMQYAAPAEVAGRTGDLLQTLASNLTDGWLYSNVWQIEAGRLFQTPALFLFGMWLGRKKFFECSDSSRIFWKKALFVAIIASAILYPLKEFVPQHLTNITILSYYSIIAGMIYNFFFMIMLVASFMLLWFHAGNAGYLWQRFITPFGRMSLTNYIGQSIIGVACYYHFGFDLWDKTGAAETLLIGIAIFMALLAFSRKWLATHSQGPLEYLWKRATWIRADRNGAGRSTAAA